MTADTGSAGAELYHEKIHAKLAHILETEEPAILAALFAKHITLGPMPTRAIASDMIQNFEIPDGKSAFDVLVSQMLTVLLSPARLEIGSLEGRDSAELHIFPFGFEAPAISFPIQILRYDWVAMACVQRFQLQGRGTDMGAPVFHQQRVTTDRTRTTYGRFAYNAILGSEMFRTSFLAVYVAVFAAQCFEQQASGGAKANNASEHARILLLDCLQKVSQRLTEVWEKDSLRRVTPAVSQLMRRQVQELVECCKDPATFTSARLVDKSVQFAAQRIAARKQRQ